MKVKQYTIETEDKYPNEVHFILAKAGIKGYSIYHKEGYWEGQKEPSISIVIIDDNHKLGLQSILKVARSIKFALHQDVVFVEEQEIELRQI